MDCSANNLLSQSNCFCGLSRKKLAETLAYLMCQWAQKIIVPTPVLSFDVSGSVAAQQTILNWTGGSASNNTQIFKNTQGAGYVPYATVTGSTYTDTTLPPTLGIIDYYKVQPSGATVSNEIGVGQTANLSNLSGQYSFPGYIFDYGQPYTNVGNPSVITFSFPDLVYAGSIRFFNCANLTHINFNPSLIFSQTAGFQLKCSGNALDAQTINFILAAARATPVLSGITITLNGGTNSPPTGQGVTDSAWLTTYGCTVMTN